LQERDHKPKAHAHTRKTIAIHTKKVARNPKNGVLGARILKPQKKHRLFIYRGTLKEVLMQKIFCFLVNTIFGGTSGKYFVYLGYKNKSL
jgi:hypothetical protein